MSSKGIFYAVLSSFLFGVVIIVNKIGLEVTGLHPVHFTTHSMIVAGVIGFVFCILRRSEIMHSSLTSKLLMILIGVSASGIAYVLLFWGQSMTKAINAAFITSLAAFFAVPFGVLLLGEKMQKKQIPYAILLLIAVYLLIVGDHTLSVQIGDLLIIGTAIIWGATGVLTKFPSREVSGEAIGVVRLVVGAVFLAFTTAVFAPEIYTNLLEQPWRWLVLSGGLTGIVIVTLCKAIELLEATKALFIMISYPVVTTLGSYLFLGETLALHQTVGAVLIPFSIYRVVR